MIGLFALMVQLVIVAGIVALVVRAVRRSGPPGLEAPERGVHALRRVLQYGFLLAALFTAAAGVARLLSTALPAQVIAQQRSADLALGLSLSLVAVPAWALLWRQVAARLADDPAERAAPAWSLYLLGALTVSLVVAYVNTVATGLALVGVDDHRPEAIASAVVWAAVWGSHARLLRHPRLGPVEPPVEPGGPVVLAGSVVGLVALAVGTGAVLAYGLGELYQLLAGATLVEGARGEQLRSGLVIGLLAAPVWWWHWLHQGVAARRSVLWHACVMLVAVLGGLLTAVIAAGVALHAVLQWLIGEPEAASAAAHFQVLPSALSAAAVGLWVWAYHSAVLRHPAPGRAVPQQRSEPERAYGYLVAGLGLLAAASGVTAAVMAAIQALTPGAMATADPGGRNALVLAITLLAVGGPLWWTFWHRLQVTVSSDVAEVRTTARRVYLFLWFGLAGLTAVISLAVILFVVFRDLLEGTLATTVLYDLRAAIGLVLTAGAVSAYHWTVQRAGRAVAPVAAPSRPVEVLLISADGRQLAAAVAAGTGATVRPLHRLDQAATPVDAEAVNAAILASPHRRVLVTVEDDGAVRVIPYELD